MPMPIDLMAAKMEAVKRDMMRQINEDLFRDAGPRQPARLLTWRDHLNRRIQRVRAYLSTLWRALRGDDPYDVDWDY
jgi:hypothetical protein